MTQSPLFDVPLGMDNRVYPSGNPSVEYTYKPDPGGESGTIFPVDFQEQAKQAVADYYNQFLAGGHSYRHPLVTKDDIFIVWFVKVLQNWKALVSTIFEDNRYFELTYSGDKRELYVDEYNKKGNEVFVLHIPSQRSDEHC